MADGGNDHACVPGADDGVLHLRVTGDVNHRSESARKEDRVIVQHVDFGKPAATGQAPVCLAVEERGLRGVVGVEPIFWRLAPEWGSELDGDAGSVKHFEGMGYLRKEKSRWPFVGADYGGVCRDKQNIGDTHSALLDSGIGNSAGTALDE
jgi:hypothetical protein